MFKLSRLFAQKNNFINSRLFDETSFYKAFINDLENCKNEVIIESPYITSSRMEKLLPTLQNLVNKKIKVYIITRDPVEHDETIRYQATNEILKCIEIGIKVVLLEGNHHRKLAIIDRTILYEGSLNILSFYQSREVMRRMYGINSALEMIKFLKLQKFL